MKVLLRRNVSKLGKIGEVVKVKPGYARNYLLPQGLAVEPSDENLAVIESEKAAYLEQLAKEHAELEARAEVINGREITITARANDEGHLYGSVGPAQIATALAEGNVFVDPSEVALDQPIRQLDKYEVKINLGEEASATITVNVTGLNEQSIFSSAPGAEETPDEDATEDVSAEAGSDETAEEHPPAPE